MFIKKNQLPRFPKNSNFVKFVMIENRTGTITTLPNLTSFHITYYYNRGKGVFL